MNDAPLLFRDKEARIAGIPCDSNRNVRGVVRSGNGRLPSRIVPLRSDRSCNGQRLRGSTRVRDGDGRRSWCSTNVSGGNNRGQLGGAHENCGQGGTVELNLRTAVEASSNRTQLEARSTGADRDRRNRR